MLQESVGKEQTFFSERPIETGDLAPVERYLSGSTEPLDSYFATQADGLTGSLQQTNIIRSRSEIHTDEAGELVAPSHVFTPALMNDEATFGIISSRMYLHLVLPPLSHRGKVGGEWELALVTRPKSGEQRRVVTDQNLYTQFVSDTLLDPRHRDHFSILPPAEGKLFPRLVYKAPSLRRSA